jgi:sulfate transport system substrate-binding protein
VLLFWRGFQFMSYTSSQEPALGHAATHFVVGALSSVKRAFKPSVQTSALLLAAGLSLGALLPAPASARTNPSAPASQEQEQLSQRPRTIEITLVTYAVTKTAFDNITALFAEKWKQEHNGQEVVFNASYGGSGSQTRAVIDGLEADIVALALAGDVEKIEEAGLIEPGWESEAPNNAIITNSVVTFVTREGNPKRIRTWSDLVRPDVTVITANPKTSGGARWNFLGLWGSVTQTGGTEEQARAFVQQVYSNAPVLPKDARESTDVFFTRGQGDVLLNYENEVILAAQNGETGFFSVIPPVNIKIEGPVAVVDTNVDKHDTREVAEAFVEFLYTPEAQREFAKVGFRPINQDVAAEFQSQFPQVSQLFTVETFGGWGEIGRKFFADGAIFDQIYAPR